MINTENLEQAKKLIKEALESREEVIIVKAQNEEFNRRILEYGKFDIFLDSYSKTEKKSSLRRIDSGLNHVLAKIAGRNNVAIGIDLDKIRRMEKKDKSFALEKIRQNIKICRRAKTKIKIVNFKDKRNAFSFMVSLGASTQQAKESIL